jgi:GTPase SAR1 family protein
MSTIHTTTATLPPRVLIYGPEGVGKTTLAAKFPAPVFLQTEDGCPGNLTISTFGALGDYKPVREALSFLAASRTSTARSSSTVWMRSNR